VGVGKTGGVEDGADGVDGVDGFDGVDGVDGFDVGDNGFDGDDGFDGVDEEGAEAGVDDGGLVGDTGQVLTIVFPVPQEPPVCKQEPSEQY